MPFTLLVLALGMAQQDWYTFEPDGKNLRVELPSKPNSTSSRTVTNAAGRAEVTTAQLRTAEASYSIQITESPAKINPKTLEDGIQRFGATSRATLGALTTITVDGNPGREFAMTEESDEGAKRSKARWVAAGKSLIILTVTGKPGVKLTASADRFLGSLELGAAKPVERARARADDSAGGEPKVADRPRARADDAAAGEGKARDRVRDKADPFVPGEPPAKDDDTSEDKHAEGKPAFRKPPTLSKVTISRVPKTAKSYLADELVELPRSYLVRERDGFRDLGPEGSVLVGVRVSYLDRFGGSKVRSVQPIYRSGKSHYQGRIYGEALGPFATFVASPGYAVGGLVTHAGLMMDGFGIVFMKVDGDHLDPGDTYNSPWIGDKRGGGPGEVTTTGGLVVGLQGRADKELKALGLLMLK